MLVRLGDEDVRRLDVAVDEPAIVGRVERGGDLLEQTIVLPTLERPVPPQQRPRSLPST